VSQAGAPCSVSPTSTSANFTSAGGSSNVVVTANGTECSWTAASDSDFITITSGGSGSGNGTVNYTVAPNTDTTVRAGTITIAGQVFTVTQDAAPCSLGVSAISASFDSAGGSNNVVVTANGTNCAWTAVSNDDFITITSGTSGTGNGMVNYSVASNNSNCVPRTGTMTIVGQTFTVTQSAGSGSYSIAPTGVAYGSDSSNSGSVSVVADNGCAWTAVSSVGWITITSGSSGTGSGTVNYSVATNPGAVRTGTITIAGQTLTIEQTGAILLLITDMKQTCKSKINKKAETTNTTCTVDFDLVIQNTGTTEYPKSSVLLWSGQGSTFNPNAGPSPLTEKVKALKGDKSNTIKVTRKFEGYQTGTFIFATDTDNNILASVEVPAPE